MYNTGTTNFVVIIPNNTFMYFIVFVAVTKKSKSLFILKGIFLSNLEKCPFCFLLYTGKIYKWRKRK